MEKEKSNLREVYLTTKDNPFDPKTQFDEWRVQDEDILRYFTCGLLARVCKTTTNQSEEDYVKDVENAIDEIIKYEKLYNEVPIYVKVVYEGSKRIQ